MRPDKESSAVALTLVPRDPGEKKPARQGPTTSIGAPEGRLDLTTVVGALQAVSGEIVLERLLERLTATAVEQAGADRGLVILVRGDEPRVAAEGIVEGGRVTVSLPQAAAGSAALPESMLRYVIRTHETVSLDDALTRDLFSADPYAVQTRCRSAVCLPVLKGACLKGALYLENRLGPLAFTPARMEVLGLLASQAALSLENAERYADLKQAPERTRQAEQGVRQILDTIPAMIWTASPDGIANYFSARWLDYTGRSLEEELGSGYMSTVHPDDRPRARAYRQGLLCADDTSAGVEVRLRRADGAYRWFLVRQVPLHDPAGQIVGWYGIATDIEDRKCAELRDRLFQENVALREEVDKASMFEEIVGSSPPLRAVLSRVSKVAPTDSTAFITGETGSGKELIARAIHRRSPRSSRPFVAVNCAVLPKELIASELFGHEKGAFTGALQRRMGRFELAEGGTLFLDEAGEIPPAIQVALLRVLQERRFERVGGNKSISCDVRVIAATNIDLDAAMNAGTFRRDLFYRLNVFPIRVPSLHERREDIPHLVEYFIGRFAAQAGKKFRRINKKSLDLLQSYHWPGNIRELQNVIERSVILCDAEEFSVDEHWLASCPPAEEPKEGTLDERLSREERKLIEAALAECGGKVAGSSGAAAKLGTPATTLYSKIQSLRIDRRRFRRA